MATEHAAEIELQPAFHDFDQLGVVWHGRYVKYLEAARGAVLAQIDYDYPQMIESGYTWPVVDLRIKFVRPIVYGQRVSVRAEIVEWEHRLKFQYLLRATDDGQRLTVAHTIQVAVDMRSKEMCYASPEVLLRKLGKLS